MHKNRYYKAPKPQLKSQHKLKKQKPEWTTDFTDPQKYKLSQAQMIERKAALQSKNRQSARRDLQQRRRKLEMGVVDEQTKKVYQTALHAKKIDLNPPSRKNLSQMIQMQRQRRQQQLARIENQQQAQYIEQEDDEDIDKQIEEAQNFIKRLQKAKKQGNIEKAVDIMLDDKKSTFFGTNKSPKQSKETLIVESKIQQTKNHEQSLTNIEQTIKFMEEKLFNKKNNRFNKPKSAQILQQQQEKVPLRVNNFMNSPDTNPISHRQQSYQLSSFQHYQTNSNKQNLQNTVNQQINYISSPKSKTNNYNTLKNNFDKNRFNKIKNQKSSFEDQFSGLRIQLNEPQAGHQQDQDCMSTIRRMREMIQSKQYLYEPQRKDTGKQNISHFSNYQQQNSHFRDLIQNGDDEEVDFSLTMNQQQEQQLEKEAITVSNQAKHSGPDFKIKLNPQKQLQQIKRNLFEQVDKLNEYSIQTQFKNTKPLNLRQAPSEQQIDQPQSEIRVTNKMKKKKKKQNNSEIDNQFRQLESIIQNNKSNVQKIHVEPIGMYGSKGVMGFDYRGSINLKKNISR